MSRQVFRELTFPDAPSELLTTVGQDYWSIEEDGTWTYSVKQLQRKYSLSQPKLAKLTREVWAAYELPPCKRCHNPNWVHTCGSRADFLNVQSMLQSYGFTCDHCKVEIKKEQEEEKQRARDAAHVAREAKRATVAAEAYETGIYQSLKPIELRVLIEVASLPGGSKVSDGFKKVGISESRGEEVIEKLLQKNLMVYCPCHGYAFPDHALEKLRALKESVLHNPILNPMEREIYRRLKVKHAVIFPHQLLRTFVPEHIARKVLERYKNISFGSYLCMEVDFLITDDEYRPVRAVEYQGGYHYNEGQDVKDEFKREVCEAAGVPLTAFEKSSLWKAEELDETTTL